MFSLDEGGAVCRACTVSMPALFPVRPGEIRWMKDVLRVGVEKTACPCEDVPLRLLMSYVENRIERRPPAAKLIT